MEIRKISMVIAISLLSCNLLGCSDSKVKTNIKAETDWKIVKTMDVKQSTYLGGFYDINFGITVGYNGEVHYTTDGGASWPKSINASACRFGLYIK